MNCLTSNILFTNIAFYYFQTIVAPAPAIVAHQPAITVAKTVVPAAYHAQPIAYAQPQLVQAPLYAKAAYVH